MLYVVGFPQALHFKTLFAQARRWGYDRVEFEHVRFGSVLGKDGKPFKTRKGGAIELVPPARRGGRSSGWRSTRRATPSAKAHGHDVPDLTDDEKRDIAEAVGIGAVKYADLSQNRTSDYMFDYDKMLATDGNTATYMQYAYARCRGIFRKADVDEARFRTDPPAVVLDAPGRAGAGAATAPLPGGGRDRRGRVPAAPHHRVPVGPGEGYSVFFENCPVLKAETPELQDSRLLLVDLVGRVIQQALDLLGIRTVERM